MVTTASTVKTTAPAPTRKKRIRKIFGDIHEVIDMPNLIEVQKSSYNQFLQKGIAHEERGDRNEDRYSESGRLRCAQRSHLRPIVPFRWPGA